MDDALSDGGLSVVGDKVVFVDPLDASMSRTGSETSEEIEARVGAAKLRRLELTADLRGLVDDVAGLLFVADPVGINFGDNRAEYEPEAESIVIGLATVADAEGALALTCQVFVQWFSAEDAGPVEGYRVVALEIWRAWLRHASRQRSP